MSAEPWLSSEQRSALEQVACAFGWDRISLDDMRLTYWVAFHYYVMRLRKESDKA